MRTAGGGAHGPGIKGRPSVAQKGTGDAQDGRRASREVLHCSAPRLLRQPKGNNTVPSKAVVHLNEMTIRRFNAHAWPRVGALLTVSAYPKSNKEKQQLLGGAWRAHISLGTPQQGPQRNGH